MIRVQIQTGEDLKVQLDRLDHRDTKVLGVIKVYRPILGVIKVPKENKVQREVKAAAQLEETREMLVHKVIRVLRVILDCRATKDLKDHREAQFFLAQE